MRPTFLPYPYQANEGDDVKQYKPNQREGELEVHGVGFAELDNRIVATIEGGRQEINENDKKTLEIFHGYALGLELEVSSASGFCNLAGLGCSDRAVATSFLIPFWKFCALKT